MTRLTTQPEIAYLTTAKKVTSITDPPEGFFFRAWTQQIPTDATQEQVYQFLNSILIPCEDLYAKR